MKPCSSLLFCAVATVTALVGSLAANAQLRITEVNITTRTVEVTNFGASAVSLASWFFCHQFTYPNLGGSLAAGASRQFTVNFNQTASDLCLYSSNANFGNENLMEDFIQWGSGGNGRQTEAVRKGIWTAGTFFPLPPAGKSFHARGLSMSGLRTANWFAGWPHPGFPVPDIKFESIVLAGGEWHVIAQSFYLTSAHRADVRDDLTLPWGQIASPTITELGSGRIDVRFPATGTRQFARVRAEF